MDITEIFIIQTIATEDYSEYNYCLYHFLFPCLYFDFMRMNSDRCN